MIQSKCALWLSNNNQCLNNLIWNQCNNLACRICIAIVFDIISCIYINTSFHSYSNSFNHFKPSISPYIHLSIILVIDYRSTCIFVSVSNDRFECKRTCVRAYIRLYIICMRIKSPAVKRSNNKNK